MSSIKNLKKDINYVLGDVIDECYTWELLNPEKGTKSTDALIDESINTFDTLIKKVHQKDVENKKAHFKAIAKELEDSATSILKKINDL